MTVENGLTELEGGPGTNQSEPHPNIDDPEVHELMTKYKLFEQVD
jgi:hypothetical protein